MKNHIQHELREIELNYSVGKEVYENTSIHSSQEAFNYFKNLFTEGKIGFKEEFYAIPLNRSNKPLGAIKMSEGGISGTVVDVRILLSSLLKCLATGVIIAHNHPSGNKKPSEPDKRLTKQIEKACSFFEIKLLDHLILTPTGEYYSFMEMGEL
tara:strand:+ start:31497 stop:31958 length:462 start_codon:yes stop_codon:yes gene_type:complete